MQTVLYVVEIAIALGLIIFVHELGHFVAAKGFGVWVRRFAIGFGPPIIKWTRGDTEYSLRAFPFGGFVEPMGDHPESEGGDDPRALWRRPAWQRIIVFAAGVAMNAVLAVVFFTAAFMIGVKAISPLVGAVTPLMPAQKAGILPGDRIVAINDTPVESFDDIQTILSSSDAGTAFDVTVERPKAGAAEPERTTFKNVVTQRDAADVGPRLGIEPEAEPVLYGILPGSPEAQAGLKTGDRVLAIDGRPVQRWYQMEQMLDEHPAGPVKFQVQRGGSRLELSAVPANLKRLDLGMMPPLLIAGVDPGSPAAKAGLKRGDRILRIGDLAWPTAEQLVERIRATPAGGTVDLIIQRVEVEAGRRTLAWALVAAAAAALLLTWLGLRRRPDSKAWRAATIMALVATGGLVLTAIQAPAMKDVTLSRTCTPAVLGDSKDPRIGVAPVPNMASPIVVGWVAPGGPAAREGIQAGDTILKIGPDARTPRSWDDVAAIVGEAGGKAVPVLIKRGENRRTTSFAPDAKAMDKFILVGSKPGELLYEPLPRIYNPLTAAGRGLKRTWVWMGRACSSVVQLAKREVSTGAVGGPVLIVQASLWVAPQGIGTFMDFWGKLCIFIAVLNFLPVPPFDGGHVLFVILERIKGSPISLKVRLWVWGFGWAAVGLLFAVVMWQDIARLIS